jgi:hypothetical protein
MRGIRYFERVSSRHTHGSAIPYTEICVSYRNCAPEPRCAADTAGAVLTWVRFTRQTATALHYIPHSRRATDSSRIQASWGQFRSAARSLPGRGRVCRRESCFRQPPAARLTARRWAAGPRVGAGHVNTEAAASQSPQPS